MLGRKASLKALRAALYRHRPTALRTTEFAQGALHWCSSDMRVLLQPGGVMLWEPRCCRMASSAAAVQLASSRSLQQAAAWLEGRPHLASLVCRAHNAVGPGLVVCRGPGEGIAAAGTAAAAAAPGSAAPRTAVGLMRHSRAYCLILTSIKSLAVVSTFCLQSGGHVRQQTVQPPD